jgi:hypothetical protein
MSSGSYPAATGIDLGARLTDATQRARVMLGQSESAGGAIGSEEPERLHELIGDLTAHVSALRGRDAGRRVREHEVTRDRLRARFQARFDGLVAAQLRR